MTATFVMFSGEEMSKKWHYGKYTVKTRTLGDTAFAEMLSAFDKFIDSTTHDESGGAIKQIECIELYFYLAPVLAKSSYIETPKILKKSPILNLQNRDKFLQYDI